MKINWSVFIALLLIAGMSLWAANSQRSNATISEHESPAAESVNSAPQSTSAAQPQIAFIVVLGIIFSALFYVASTPDHQPTRALRKILIKR